MSPELGDHNLVSLICFLLLRRKKNLHRTVLEFGLSPCGRSVTIDSFIHLVGDFKMLFFIFFVTTVVGFIAQFYNISALGVFLRYKFNDFCKRRES